MSDTELSWQDLYEHAVQAFGGQTPGKDLEAELIEAFEQTPATVKAAITKIAGRYVAGKIHTPWPIIRKELARAAERAAIKADVKPEKDQATRLAELEIRNTLYNLPTEEELLDTLFGTHGRLKTWNDDEALKQGMLKLWNEQRPRGIAAELAIGEQTERRREARQQAELQLALESEPGP